MSDSIRLPNVVHEAARLARATTPVVASVWLLLLLMYGTADLLLTGSNLLRLQGVLGLVTLYLQLLVTGIALSKAQLSGYAYDPSSPTQGRYPSMFGQSVIFSLGVAIGLVLLVVPGLFLLVRWSVCVPALLGEDLTIADSLRRSWNLTRLSWKTVSLVEGLIAVTWAFPVLASIYLYPDATVPSLPTSLLVNALFGIAWIGGWLLSVATYVLLRNMEDRLSIPRATDDRPATSAA